MFPWLESALLPLDLKYNYQMGKRVKESSSADFTSSGPRPRVFDRAFYCV